MTDLFDEIAHLENASLRRTWLLEKYPLPNRAFVHSLQSAAHTLERDDHRKTILIAGLLGDAAELWDDRQTLAVALRVEAQSLRGTEPLHALHKYEEAVRLFQVLELPTQAADAAVGQVAALRTLGRYDDAFALNEWVVATFRTADPATGDGAFGLARALLNHGLICYYLGRFPEARSHYAEAHALFVALDQPHWCAAVESNDANVLEELDEYPAAEAKYLRARERYAAAGMTNAVAQVDHNLAYLHYALGDYQQALHLFGRAREQFVHQESEIDIAFVDLYRTEIYVLLNLWRKALDLARLARPIFERAQMPWETARLLLNEAISLLHLTKSELALEKLGQARRLLTGLGHTHWPALVDFYESCIHLRTPNYDAALLAAQSAHDAFLAHGLARRAGQAAIVLGQVALATEQLDEAASSFARAESLLGTYASPAATYLYDFGLARIHHKRGDVATAESHYLKAIAAIGQLHAKIGAEDYKLAFWSDKLHIYERFIHFCLEQQHADYDQKAFEIFEQSKLGALRYLTHAPNLASVTNTRLTTATEEDTVADEIVQIGQLRRELNRYYTQLHTPDSAFTSDADVARLHAAIVYREQRLSNLLDARRHLDFALVDPAIADERTQGLTLSQLQSGLPSETILLEYFFLDDQLTIFCVEQQRFTVRRLRFSLEQLQELARQFNFQISKFHLGTRFRERHRRLLQNGIDSVLQQLYELLIAPVAGLLENADHIMIVPHQLLHNLPFHALFDGKRYLIETHGVSYAISAAFQHKLRGRPPLEHYAPPLILGLNDPLIQQAEEEAAAIGKIFPDAERYCGSVATAARLRATATPRQFIHLATHGVFRPDNPIFSALKLADGWLTLQELSLLRHSAPLITLSACNTGRSELLSGDHVVDFYRGLFRTGAQSLVVSLWSLEDQAATYLMTAFYQELRHGETVYTALRRAQLAMMSIWRHPYYWAPFLLTGDPFLNVIPVNPSPDPLERRSQQTVTELHP